MGLQHDVCELLGQSESDDPNCAEHADDRHKYDDRVSEFRFASVS
jgi:hypothetical protein